MNASGGIVARDIAVTYGELVAIEEINIRCVEGLTVLVGVNGSGKSSLIKAIAGSVACAHGDVTVAGMPAGEARKQGLLAYVPQHDAVDWDFPLSVRDVVVMGCYGAGLGRAAQRERVDRALARVELSHLAERQIGELSGGQKRRVFLARALAQAAPHLVLDEPMAGVDVSAQGRFYTLLRELVDEGKTIVMSTHDVASVPAIADHAIVLQRTVIAEGAPKDVLTPEVLARAFGMDA